MESPSEYPTDTRNNHNAFYGTTIAVCLELNITGKLKKKVMEVRRQIDDTLQPGPLRIRRTKRDFTDRYNNNNNDIIIDRRRRNTIATGIVMNNNCRLTERLMLSRNHYNIVCYYIPRCTL